MGGGGQGKMGRFYFSRCHQPPFALRARSQAAPVALRARFQAPHVPPPESIRFLSTLLVDEAAIPIISALKKLLRNTGNGCGNSPCNQGCSFACVNSSRLPRELLAPPFDPPSGSLAQASAAGR